MKNLFNFLESIDRPISIEIGNLKINNFSLKSNESIYFEGVIFCKPIHFQPLKNLGVKIDFTDKKVGFAQNQNTIGLSGNTNAIRAKMDFQTFKKVSIFFRKNYEMNIKNDFELKLLGFPFTQRK